MECEIRIYKKYGNRENMYDQLTTTVFISFYFVTSIQAQKLNNVDKLNRKNAKNVDILSR